MIKKIKKYQNNNKKQIKTNQIQTIQQIQIQIVIYFVSDHQNTYTYTCTYTYTYIHIYINKYSYTIDERHRQSGIIQQSRTNSRWSNQTRCACTRWRDHFCSNQWQIGQFFLFDWHQLELHVEWNVRSVDMRRRRRRRRRRRIDL